MNEDATSTSRGARIIAALVWALVIAGVGWAVFGAALALQGGASSEVDNTFLHRLVITVIFGAARLLGEGGSLALAIAATVLAIAVALRILRPRA